MWPAGDALPCGCAFLEDVTIAVHGDISLRGLMEKAAECRKHGGAIEILRGGSERIVRETMRLRSIDGVLHDELNDY